MKAKKMSRRRWFWIIGFFVLEVVGLLWVGRGLLGRLSSEKSGNLYEDPQGRFTMQVDPGWEVVATDELYTQFKLADPPMDIFLLVLKAGTIHDAFSKVFVITGSDPDLLTGGAVTRIGDWQAYGKEDSAGINYGLAAQIVGENAYVMMVKADKPGVWVKNGPVPRAVASIKITESLASAWTHE